MDNKNRYPHCGNGHARQFDSVIFFLLTAKVGRKVLQYSLRDIEGEKGENL
ncbi:hypothetical protein [Limosilactobacillus fermentum]|uniref:hypothetical protein n=1 Tax=Limosilactobacillus fermentum TaxID=1613 RepID=UPI0027B93280|nr:hypothetical protein [Limosilactobacillus fermentum]WLW44755.1 hypothetical protein RA155_01450 [Limosilactobacillus fermentum]